MTPAMALWVLVVCLAALVAHAAGSPPESGGAEGPRASADYVLAIDINTGAVLHYSPGRSLQGKRISIGSTIKPFTMLAAARSGVLDPDRKVECAPSKPTDPAYERCWDYRGHGMPDLEKALAFSCNSWFRDLAERVDLADFIAVVEQFGLGGDVNLPQAVDRRTKIELMLGLEDHLKVEIPDLLAAYAALFNGGRLFRARSDGRGGISFGSRRMIKMDSRLRDLLLAGMRRCATDGICRQAQRELGEIPIIGKTGTAMYSLHGGDYRRTHGLFIALGPYPEPRFASVVVMREGTGANAAVPAAVKYLKKLLGP